MRRKRGNALNRWGGGWVYRRKRGNALNRWEGGGGEEGERKCLEQVGGGGV